ncbi:MAG: DMT family transporter [Niabella sp.]
MTSVVVTIAVLFRIFSNPFANVFQKKLTGNKVHALFVNFATYALLAVGCMVGVLFMRQTGFQLSAAFWKWSLLAAVCGALGNALLVKAVEQGELSILGPVNAYKSVVAMLIGIFVLREIPGSTGVLGVALIIWGSYFVLNTTEEGFSWQLFKRRDIQYRVAAMVLTAVEAVFLKRVILLSSPTIGFIFWCCYGAVFSFLLVCIRQVSLKREMMKFGRTQIVYLLLITLCMGVMQFSTNYVFDHIPVGYALSFFQLSIIVSVFLGHRFFGEAHLMRKLLGAGIMVAGAALIVAAG